MKPVIAALSLVIAVSACGTSPQAPPRTDASLTGVALSRVETAQLPSQFEAGGVVRARLTASIASRVLAPVIDVRVRPGDRVSAGQVLISLDGRELEAQANRAAAALAAARQSVNAAVSDTQAAAAGLTLATASFDRINGLHAKRSATSQELDEATAALQTARARRAGADAHAAEASAALTAAEAGADAAKISASYARLTAPFAGRVADRFVDPGGMSAPGVPLLTIEDTALFRLEVRLDEARANQIAVGQPAQINTENSADGMWRDARVSEVSRLDPAGHGFVVKIDIPAAVASRSGGFGRARFAAAARATTTVPASSLVRRGQLTFVFAVDSDGIARLRTVTTGASTGDRVEVLAGVSAGDEVVTSPPPSLTDGTRVKAGAAR